MSSVEKIFGGILALIVLCAAIFMVAGGNWNRGGDRTPSGPVITTPTVSGPPIVVTGNDVLCQCFDQAFDLAGEDADVMSSQYRTGFESCRGVAGPRGGEAWTAGWNARLSSKPFQASCGAWIRRG